MTQHVLEFVLVLLTRPNHTIDVAAMAVTVKRKAEGMFLVKQGH